jgi:HlyD family secretion protein
VVRQRELQLAQARVDLERTEIRAPVDGIVVKKSVEPGQTVAASLQAPELFVIAQDLREMQVDTSIDESEVGRVRVGQEASFTVDSFPGRSFRGTVAQVRKAAQVVQNVVTYIAVIRASNPDLSLFPGMTANVRVIIAMRENVLKVPNAALRFRPVGASDAPAAGRSEAAGDGEEKGKGVRGQGMLERLTAELELTADQRAKVQAILAETRAKIGGISNEDKGERRKEVERTRTDSRTRIAELLNPEQRARYDALAGEARRGGVTSARVWLAVAGNEPPRAVNVRLGLTDGMHSELVSGNLEEGAEVIVGLVQDPTKARPTQQPTGPRLNF